MHLRSSSCASILVSDSQDCGTFSQSLMGGSAHSWGPKHDHETKKLSATAASRLRSTRAPGQPRLSSALQSRNLHPTTELFETASLVRSATTAFTDMSRQVETRPGPPGGHRTVRHNELGVRRAGSSKVDNWVQSTTNAPRPRLESPSRHPPSSGGSDNESG